MARRSSGWIGWLIGWPIYVAMWVGLLVLCVVTFPFSIVLGPVLALLLILVGNQMGKIRRYWRCRQCGFTMPAG